MQTVGRWQARRTGFVVGFAPGHLADTGGSLGVPVVEHLLQAWRTNQACEAAAEGSELDRAVAHAGIEGSA